MKTLLLMTMMLATAASFAQKTTTPAPSKLAELLPKTGYEFTKLDEGIWITTVEGEFQKEIGVVITESEGMTILFSMIKYKEGFKPTMKHLSDLLKLTMELDRVKIGLDDKETLMVRIDLTSRLLDLQELKENIDQIGVAADETYGIILKK